MNCKELVLKTVYPILDCLPSGWAMKAKIIGNVLLNDWSMAPVVPFDVRRAMSETEARKFFDCEDEETVQLLHRQYELGEMFVEEAQCRRFFFNHTGLFYPCSKETVQSIHQAKRRFMKRTGLHDVGPETFFYKHGLVFLDERQRSFLRGRDVIDAGAYMGESICALLESEPSHIYSFEPSPQNCRHLHDTIARIHMDGAKITVVQMGLSDHAQMVHVQDSRGACGNMHTPGEEAWDITTLDQFAESHPMQPGFLKADVEGEALKLLKGALHVIRSSRPILSIAVYHSAEEFLGVPELLSSLNYTVRLRCLNPLHIFGEVTVLAIPREEAAE